VAALFGNESLYEELSSVIDKLEVDLTRELSETRVNSSELDPKRRKNYVYFLLGRMDSGVKDNQRQSIDPTNIFVQFPLQTPILDIANAYFQMYTRLAFVNVWHTFPTSLEPRSSQLWHYDPEDRHVLKIFLYLTDVDSEAGPFIYGSGTQPKGSSAPLRYFDSAEDKRSRANDATMLNKVPADRWIECTGKKGTIIFADTRGYHKGGYATERERIMYQCTFVSDASQYQYFKCSRDRVSSLDRPQAFALKKSFEANKLH
jgi:hypothetical protein